MFRKCFIVPLTLSILIKWGMLFCLSFLHLIVACIYVWKLPKLWGLYSITNQHFYIKTKKKKAQSQFTQVSHTINTISKGFKLLKTVWSSSSEKETPTEDLQSLVLIVSVLLCWSKA